MEVISVYKFLSRYYGISFNKKVNITHKELKNKCVFLIRCSIEFIEKNKELLAEGKVIFVEDTN